MLLIPGVRLWLFSKKSEVMRKIGLQTEKPENTLRVEDRHLNGISFNPEKVIRNLHLV